MAKRSDLFDGLTEDERAALDEADAEDTAAQAADDAALAAIVEGKPESKAETGDKPEAKAEGKQTGDKPETTADEKKADAKPETKAETKAESKTDGAAEATESAQPKAETKAEEKARAPRQAVPDWQAPENAEAKLTEIATKRDELADKFDAGELTAKELLAEQRKLDKQERDIERAADRAQMAGEMVVAVWEKSTVPAFLDAHAHYRANPVLLGMLDTEVRRQQAAASEEGKDPLDPAILTKADEAIRAAVAALGGEVKPAQPTAKETAKGAKAAEQAQKPEIPPTLGKIPAAEITGTDSKYAALDRMADADPLAFENAMAKLSQSERDAYLAQTH